MGHLKWLAAALLGVVLALVFSRAQSRGRGTGETARPGDVQMESSQDGHVPSRGDLRAKEVVVVRTAEAVTTDPKSAAYDPAMILRINQTDASELFEQEPRIESWARGFEARVQHYVRTSLSEIAVDAKVSVECRTAICKVAVDVSTLSESDAELISDYLSHSAPIGDFAQTGGSGNTGEPGKLVIFTALSPQLRTEDGFSDFVTKFAEGGAERIQAHREELLEKLRADNQQ